MASRRDELNAYTFARKRMVGAFLQPSGGGNDEDAPRPLRAVLPSVVVAAVTVAGFGLWGVFKPSAPQGWDSGKFILQGKDSTTRYVITPDKKLHQVLNMASARLVAPADATVQTVADDVLDKYVERGPTIGIPYAPDKLPKKDDAGVAKKWSVCDKPGQGGTQSTVVQTVFVAADKDATTLGKSGKMLADGQSLIVQAPPEAGSGHPDGSEYLVDPNGFKHAIGGVGQPRSGLESAVFTAAAANNRQQVTADWVNTLQAGTEISYPPLPDGFESSKVVNSSIGLSKPEDNRVGRLLQYQDNTFFVVGRDKLYEITPFTAQLMRYDPRENVVYGGGLPTFDQLTPADFTRLAATIDKNSFRGPADWPTAMPTAPVNGTDKGARTVICSTFDGYQDNGQPKQSVWADTDYPASVGTGAVGAHVTAGHGLLFRAMDGQGGVNGSGSEFLITDTGLRYSLQANNDGGTGAAASAAPPQPGAQQSGNEAQARLGYKDVTPTPVPKAWALLVPAGPALSTGAAVQPQNA